MLRAGLGMADAALALLPESSMGFVGLARDEETFEPRAYMESLPGDLAGLPVLVLDPMLATGGSLVHCCRLLADRGCTDITVCCVLAAPEGIERLDRSGLPLRLVTASIDEGLNDKHVHRARASATPATASSAACPGSDVAARPPCRVPGSMAGPVDRASGARDARSALPSRGHDWCCAGRGVAPPRLRRRDRQGDRCRGSASTSAWPPRCWSSWPWRAGSRTPTGHLTVIDPTPTGEPIADEVLARIAADTPHTPGLWVQRLRHGLRDRILDDLVPRRAWCATSTRPSWASSTCTATRRSTPPSRPTSGSGWPRR